MTIFVINVGDVEYSRYSIPLIQQLADYNNIPLFVLEHNISQNIYNAHPSWLKLFCHDLIADDFIISWDLDLVPTRLYKLDNLFNLNAINMTYDSSYIKHNHIFNGKFKYNCGLIGIPQRYSEFFKTIYYTNSMNSVYPSYEQYHVNDKIYDNNEYVHVLDTKLNTMYDGNINSQTFNMHYTWKITNNEHRNILVQQHYNLFKTNFKHYANL